MTAHRAGDARQRRHLDRLARRHRAGPRAVRARRPRPGPDVDDRRGHRGLLRGLLQRHPVAALPRPRRQAGVPPRVVGLLRRGQPPVRREGRRARRRGRHRVGARLPAPAGAADAARPAPRPADRLLPAHPVPARRAVPAAAVAPPDPRGAARGRPGRLPAARRRAELRPPGPPARRPQDPPRPGLPARRPHRAGRAPSRSRSTPPASRSWPAPSRSPQRAEEIREALGNPTQDLPRHRPARLHQGHLRPAARLRRADRRRPLRRRGRRVRAGGDAVARAGRAVPHPARRHRPAGRPDQRRPRPDRQARRSPTCTPPTRARRWRRSTAPPTSWSSRRSATG